MLDTDDRIDASIDATTPDDIDPAPQTAAPATRTTWARRLDRMLIGGLAAEAAVAAMATAVLVGAMIAPEPENDRNSDRAGAAVSTAMTAGDTDTFLLAWARSLEEEHRATGNLTRTRLDRRTLFSSTWPDHVVGADGTTTEWVYRHSRLDGRAMTQIGDVATVVGPVDGRRTCVRQRTGFACTVDESPTGEAMTAVEQAVEGPGATHRIVAVDAADVLAEFPRLPADIDCWEARSLTDGIDQRWGRRAQFCFHDASGAAVFRRVLGTTRVEVLVVDSVSSDVAPADLDPA